MISLIGLLYSRPLHHYTGDSPRIDLTRDRIKPPDQRGCLPIAEGPSHAGHAVVVGEHQVQRLALGQPHHPQLTPVRTGEAPLATDHSASLQNVLPVNRWLASS